MTFEKGSLILVDYTAKVKDTSHVFETTTEEEARKTDVYDPARKYGPKLVSVGEGWVLRGLDEALANANSGDKLTVEVPPEKGFGERNSSKVRMIAQRKLGEKADEVTVGDEIEVDNRTGIIRFIGSGRVQIDFNHRYAGRTLVYDVNILKKLETENDRVLSLIKRRFALDDEKILFSLEGSALEITLPEESFLTEGLQIMKRAVANDIFKYVNNIKNIKFIEPYVSSQEPQQQSKEQQTQVDEKPIESVENRSS